MLHKNTWTKQPAFVQHSVQVPWRQMVHSHSAESQCVVRLADGAARNSLRPCKDAQQCNDRASIRCERTSALRHHRVPVGSDEDVGACHSGFRNGRCELAPTASVQRTAKTLSDSPAWVHQPREGHSHRGGQLQIEKAAPCADPTTSVARTANNCNIRPKSTDASGRLGCGCG